jgi:hypothetical protein
LRTSLFHRFFFYFLCIVIGPALRRRFCYKGEIIRGISRPVVIIANHTTDIDPILIGLSFPPHCYFVASEHIFRWGFASKLLRFFFAPIAKAKGGTDTRTVADVLTALKKGYNVCIFAEGTKTFSGVTGPIIPSTGKLLRLAATLAGASLATFRLRGGYFASPRWAKTMRSGPIWGSLSGLYPPETLKTMKHSDITRLIERDIYEDAYETQTRERKSYASRPGAADSLAENLETALYLCPACRTIGRLHSSGNTLSCDCGLEYHYDVYGFLSTPQHDAAFSTVRDWWAWQETSLEDLLAVSGDKTLCSDQGEELYEIDRGKSAKLVCRGTLSIGKKGIAVDERQFPLESISGLDITGQKTITFSAEGKHWELRNPAPRSAAKYRRMFQLLTKGNLLS